MLIRTVLVLVIFSCAGISNAQQAAPAVKTQEELEADLSKLLSGATLEGSFNMTGAGADPTRLRTDKYTLGNVTKISGETWLFQTKIQYRGSDLMIPLPIPIKWAGDTPVVYLDNYAIPGFGTFSARVMFHGGTYSGYWKSERGPGGVLFGVIKPPGDPTTRPTTQPAPAP